MAKNLQGFSKEVNASKILEVLTKVDVNCDLLNNIVSDIVQKYCGELDKLMYEIHAIIFNDIHDITDAELNSMIMKLPCSMYFAGDAQESLGLREDIARSFEKDIYNTALIKATGTVSEKQSTAEIESQQEAIATILTSRAYKKIKSRLECALEMLGSLKKVLGQRVSVRELGQRDDN